MAGSNQTDFLVYQSLKRSKAANNRLILSLYSEKRKKSKVGAYDLKRLAAGAHLPTPRLFEPAERPVDRADYCLDCSFLPPMQAPNTYSFLHLSRVERLWANPGPVNPESYALPLRHTGAACSGIYGPAERAHGARACPGLSPNKSSHMMWIWSHWCQIRNSEQVKFGAQTSRHGIY